MELSAPFRTRFQICYLCLSNWNLPGLLHSSDGRDSWIRISKAMFSLSCVRSKAHTYLFIWQFFCTSYDHFLFAYGFTSSTNHALSASGSILTPISWLQRYSQRSWRGLWSSSIYDFWYSQERTISVRNSVPFSPWNKGFQSDQIYFCE